MPAIQQARNKLFSQTSNISLSMSQIAASLCPIYNSQSSQPIQDQQPEEFHQDRSSQQQSQAAVSTQQSQAAVSTQQSQEAVSQQQNSQQSTRKKRSRDSGIITMQPSTSAQTPSADTQPKKKNKKTGRRPFDIYKGTKPLSAGECNQSRRVAAKRNSIEVRFYLLVYFCTYFCTYIRTYLCTYL